jgi:hypothetical protein
MAAAQEPWGDSRARSLAEQFLLEQFLCEHTEARTFLGLQLSISKITGKISFDFS